MENQHYSDLLEYLLSFMPMPGNFSDLVFPGFTDPITYAEDYLAFGPGDVADMAYWPIEGYIRTYTEYQPEHDREMKKQQTEDISLPGHVFLLEDSFMTGHPADCFMEITKGTTVIGYSRESYLELEMAMPVVSMLALKVISVARRDHRMKAKLSKMPLAVGYPAFRKLFGEEVESYVYLKDIATFLGTTAGNLSRIRSEGGYGDEGLRKKATD